jgi:hypothetical protein
MFSGFASAEAVFFMHNFSAVDKCPLKLEDGSKQLRLYVYDINRSRSPPLDPYNEANKRANIRHFWQPNACYFANKN